MAFNRLRGPLSGQKHETSICIPESNAYAYIIHREKALSIHMQEVG